MIKRFIAWIKSLRHRAERIHSRAFVRDERDLKAAFVGAIEEAMRGPLTLEQRMTNSMILKLVKGERDNERSHEFWYEAFRALGPRKSESVVDNVLAGNHVVIKLNLGLDMGATYQHEYSYDIQVKPDDVEMVQAIEVAWAKHKLRDWQ